MSFSTSTSTINTTGSISGSSLSTSMSASTPGYNKQASGDAFDMMALTDLIEFDSDSDVDVDMLDFFDTESSFSNLPGEGGDLLPSDDLLAELESIDEHMPAPSSLCDYHKNTNNNNNSSTSSLSYSEVEKKLEESMNRSSLTRERIAAFRQQELQQQYHHSCTSNASFGSANNNSIPEIKVDLNQPLKPQTVASCAAFLMGSRPTLTTALEQSRKQLQEYMASLNQGSAM